MRYKKEIDALIECGKAKHLSLPEVQKCAPKYAKWLKHILAGYRSGKIRNDEMSSCFSYYMGEILEVVYGLPAYEYYKAKFGKDAL